MAIRSHAGSVAAKRDPRRWHIALILVLSSFWESLFIWKGSNLLDEGWALYVGMQLHLGERLYDGASWVFPPGHALPGWLGYAIDPRGVTIPRAVYAAFTVALCIALYELGRRLMPPRFALLGATLLAVAAPLSHMMHLLYGYRYMLWAALVLLAFSARLETGRRAWIFAAGVLAGVSLYFRVTPAFAVSCGIGVGVLAASRSPTSWMKDWILYALGLALVMGPVLTWFEWTVGLDRVWREVIVHPVAMLQPLPVPDLFVPAVWTRETLTEAWRPVALRLFLALYAGYALVLGFLWIRSLRRRTPFQHALLVAVVVWGGVFFVRSFGRADQAHMDTTLPPICLLLAHALSVATSRFGEDRAAVATERRWVAPSAIAAVFCAWVFLSGSDLYPRPGRFERVGLSNKVVAGVELIERHTEPGDVILDMTAAPMFHALSGRPGPGRSDIIMPGTFMDDEEELVFLQRLEDSPPVAVLWPRRHFDDMASRSVFAVAPRVSAWVQRHYVPAESTDKFQLRLRRGGRNGAGVGDRTGDDGAG